MDNVTCTNCGVNNKPNVKYCIRCGYELPKPKIEPIDEKVQQSIPKPTNTKKLLLSVIGFIIVFGLSYWAVQQFIFKSSSENKFDKTNPIMNDEFSNSENSFPHNDFSMDKPMDWIVADNKEILENLEKFELTEENFTKLIHDNKGSFLLISYYKYNPETHAGLIPTIQINIRANAANNFDEFKNAMIQSTNSFKNYFEDFEFTVSPSVIEISGIKSIYFIGNFSMQIQNGETIKVRSRTYAIPNGDYFFQVNFTDGQDSEDCSKLFDELIETVKIGK